MKSDVKMATSSSTDKMIIFRCRSAARDNIMTITDDNTRCITWDATAMASYILITNAMERPVEEAIYHALRVF